MNNRRTRRPLKRHLLLKRVARQEFIRRPPARSQPATGLTVAQVANDRSLILLVGAAEGFQPRLKSRPIISTKANSRRPASHRHTAGASGSSGSIPVIAAAFLARAYGQRLRQTGPFRAVAIGVARGSAVPGSLSAEPGANLSFQSCRPLRTPYKNGGGRGPARHAYWPPAYAVRLMNSRAVPSGSRK